MGMIVAMVCEAGLCLPKLRREGRSRFVNSTHTITFLWTPWSGSSPQCFWGWRHGRTVLCRLAAQRIPGFDGAAGTAAVRPGASWRRFC